MDSTYQWIPFYVSLVDKLLTSSDKRNDQFKLIR